MRVVILGAGVIGLCVAYYARKKGHDVHIVERESQDLNGCSFGNAGMVVPSHFVPLAAPGMVALGLKWMWNPESPFYIKPRLSGELLRWGWRFWRASTARQVRRSAPILRDLHLASRACFEELDEAFHHEFGLVKKGLLMLCKTSEALHEEGKMAEQALELGVPAEVLSPKQTAKLDPGVTMDILGSVFFPKDCHLSPNQFMALLREHLQQEGATFQWNTDVTGFEINDRRIEAMKAGADRITGDEFVICGGSWTPSVARELAINIPMQAGKGYSLTLTEPRQLPTICSIFTEARVAVTPMGSSLRFGGTMEMAGVDTSINRPRVQGIIKSVPKYFPEFQTTDFTDLPVWSGLRPCSPDGMPYIGRLNRFDNATVASGHAMLGLSLGPVTGKLVSEVLSGQEPVVDLGLLKPDRFA